MSRFRSAAPDCRVSQVCNSLFSIRETQVRLLEDDGFPDSISSEVLALK
jgi:hypothetical protein